MIWCLSGPEISSMCIQVIQIACRSWGSVCNRTTADEAGQNEDELGIDFDAFLIHVI